MKTELIFPTPVWKFDNVGVDRELLTDFVYHVKDEDPEGRKQSNAGGWQSHDFIDSVMDNNPLKDIRDAIMERAYAAADEFGFSDYSLKMINMWININNKGASNHLHTHPGWWQYRTFTTANGDTKHKAECIAFVHATAGVAGDDADDTVVADVASAVTVTAQPAASTSSSGAGTFTLTTSTTGTPGALAYVWQRQTAASTKKWTNITASLDTGITYADFTTATLAYSGLAGDTLDGYKYRVKITSAGGTEEVITDGVGALTFGS